MIELTAYIQLFNTPTPKDFRPTNMSLNGNHEDACIDKSIILTEREFDVISLPTVKIN